MLTSFVSQSLSKAMDSPKPPHSAVQPVDIPVINDDGCLSSIKQTGWHILVLMKKNFYVYKVCYDMHKPMCAILRVFAQANTIWHRDRGVHCSHSKVGNPGPHDKCAMPMDPFETEAPYL